MNPKTVRQGAIASIFILLVLCTAVSYQYQAPEDGPSRRAIRTVAPITTVLVVQPNNTPLTRPLWKGEKIDPFRLVSFMPAPARVMAPRLAVTVVAEHAETPPFPYQFFGQMIDVEGQTLTYLTRDGTLVPVHAAQVLDQTYRIDSVSDKQIKVTYLPLNEQLTVSVQTAAQ